MVIENLESFRLHNIPDAGFYIPNYISENEEKLYLSKIYTAPKSAWKTLSNRRLQNWGGEPHPKVKTKETFTLDISRNVISHSTR